MIGPLIGILIAAGAFDHSQNSFNDTLAKYRGKELDLRSVEDYFGEDRDRPWEGRALNLD